MRKKTALKYKVLIPANLDLEVHLREYPLDIPFAKDNILSILRLIGKSDNFRVLKSEFLKSMSDNYSAISYWLRKRKIIQREEYIVGVKSFGYRYTKKYRVSPYKFEYIRKATLVKKIEKWLIEYKDNMLKNAILNGDKESETIGFFGYEPEWLSSKDVANIFNLKPRIMMKSLLQLNIVSENTLLHNKSDFDQLYYYKYFESPNPYKAGYQIRFNGDKLDQIEEIIMKEPIIFPKKT